MKTFVVAVIILIIAFIGVAVNASFVTNLTDELIALSEQNDTEAVSALWRKNYKTLSLSVHTALLEETDETLTEMMSYKQTGSASEYYAARDRFINNVIEIAAGEKVFFHTVF